MKTLGCAVIMLLACAVPVRAAQVYSGCAVPSATSRHVWYLDPVHGKTPAAGGVGSQASPWNSLTGVISGSWGASNFSLTGYTRPLLSSVPYYPHRQRRSVAVADQLGNPPVQPGDAIMLMSGNYGDIVIGDFNLPTTNSDFVTVEAAPGQVPVFSTLWIARTNKWVFNAIKVQSLLGANGNTRPSSRSRIRAHRSRPPISSWRTCRSVRPTTRLAGARPNGSRRRARRSGESVRPATARTVSPTRAASRWPDRTSRMCAKARSSPPTTRCSRTT